MTRADEWSRVDYRSRAAAAICAITTTLVAAVTVTAYVGTRKATSLPRRLLGPFLSVLTTTGPVHLTESFLAYRSAHAAAAGNVIIIGDGYYTGRVTPRKLVGHLRGRSWHERDAFAGRPKKNVLVVPVVSSFVWIAAACCCAPASPTTAPIG